MDPLALLFRRREHCLLHRLAHADDVVHPVRLLALLHGNVVKALFLFGGEKTELLAVSCSPQQDLEDRLLEEHVVTILYGRQRRSAEGYSERDLD